MKVLAFNGSPRKNGNTATLLKHALEGAASRGASTKLIHLYDLRYKGCISCFACKLNGGASYGNCAVKDELTPFLQEIKKADALILGSPIYLGTVNGEMQSFLERLIFPYLAYDENHTSLFGKVLPVGFIYTLGADEDRMKVAGYDHRARTIKMLTEKVFGVSESLFVNDTYQFDDYSKYVASSFNPEAKARRREKQFPTDCKNAFDLGARLSLVR